MLKYSLYDNMNKHLRLLFSATNVIVASNSTFCRVFRSHGNAHGQTRDKNNDATMDLLDATEP